MVPWLPRLASQDPWPWPPAAVPQEDPSSLPMQRLPEAPLGGLGTEVWAPSLQGLELGAGWA